MSFSLQENMIATPHTLAINRSFPFIVESNMNTLFWRHYANVYRFANRLVNKGSHRT